jgi:surfeit locus 1 family protein
MLLSHLLVLTVVLTMVLLGQWQLRRLAEVRTVNETLAARVDAAPIGLDVLDGVTLDDSGAIAGLEFRRVEATGTYRPEDEVLQRGRPRNGQPGFHVLTPLDTTDGTVVVRRGWVPDDLDTPGVPETAPPAGEVTVTGFLERSIPQPTGPLSQTDTPDGRLERVFHADVSRIDQQVEGDLLPMLVHLEEQSPAQGPLPLPAERPGFDEGTHLSYAVQWFIFATTATVAYGAWLRRRLSRSRAAGTTSPA